MVDYASVPDSSSFDFGTGNFTIECFFRIDTTPADGNHVFISQNDGLTVAGSSFDFGFLTSSGVCYPQAHVYSNGGTTNAPLLLGSPISLSVFYHLCLLRNGTSLRLSLDGVSSGNDPIGTNTVNNSAAKLFFSGFDLVGSEGTVWPFSGWIDEVRISDIDRYGLANFTPPAVPFISDANTIALYHFNGLNGATTTTDDSGNGHTPTLSGATAQLVTGIKKFGNSCLNLNVTPPAPATNIRNDRFFLLYN